MEKLQLKDISKQYGPITAVDHFFLDVEDGELLAILGPSGCGKSTLLSCIAGTERPGNGEIIVDGCRFFSSRKGINVPPEDRRMGFVFQHYALWPHMTVYKNIAYSLKLKKRSRSYIDENVQRILRLLRLEGKSSRYPHELSGGEQQRVALGRALIMDPALLLLDEPLSNLDAKLRESMQIEIRNIQRKLNLTVIHVTHDQSEAMAMSDRIVVMHEGRPIQTGKPVDIYTKPETEFVADFVGVNNLIQGNVYGEGDKTRFDNGTGISFFLPPDFSGAGRALLMVRPEDIELRSGNAAGGSLVGRGVISDAIYQGAHMKYIVDTGAVKLKVQLHPAETFQEGDEVVFSFNRFNRLR